MCAGTLLQRRVCDALRARKVASPQVKGLSAASHHPYALHSFFMRTREDSRLELPHALKDGGLYLFLMLGQHQIVGQCLKHGLERHAATDDLEVPDTVLFG